MSHADRGQILSVDASIPFVLKLQSGLLAGRSIPHYCISAKLQK
jgi:hypothetical protein